MTNEVSRTPSPQELEAKINAILAQTDWTEYGEEVSEQVTKEVDAYEVARARSRASAAFKFLH